ncbi:MAG TPA: hypothetical protein VN602_02200 [Gemmatimonadaceae bacterium]|nr:hypothetical protein [Gemmatimonadaceae bacterium]
MINSQEFARWMGVLGDRFNRPLAAPTARAYFEILSRDLTTAEFAAGAERCFESCKYWPSPKEIITAARPVASPELAAADVFADILRWNGRPNMMAEANERLTPEGMRAFLAVGGPAKFRELTSAEAPFVRKEFVAAFVAASRDAGEAKSAGEAISRARDYKRIDNGPQRIGSLLGDVMPRIEGVRT